MIKPTVFDIEGNNLLYDIDKIWCIAIKEGNDKNKVYGLRVYNNCAGTLDEGMEILKNAELLVGHNIIKFDIPAIKKVLGVDLFEDRDIMGVYDTLLGSQLKYPNLMTLDGFSKTLPPKYKGKHGLKAWGYRLKCYKGDFGEQENAWDKFTEEMADYCLQDVEVTYKLYRKLVGQVPDEAIWLEQSFARVIGRQEAHGWLFDIAKAEELHVELVEEQEQAWDTLTETFVPLATFVPLNKPPEFKKDGNNTVNWLKQMDREAGYNDDGEWGCYEDVEFKPTSGQSIVRWIEHLYGEQNWERNKPCKAYPEGSPKTGAEAINEAFSQYSWAYPLLRYLIITKLLSQLVGGKKAWIVSIMDDGRIHGSVDTVGAVTRRCTHKDPNVAQVPSGEEKGNLSPELRAFKAELGARCRGLFIVPKGKKLVGCDADQLELRMLSHYLTRHDDGAYGQVVETGDKAIGTDIHSMNAKAVGLSRNDGKTFIYAFLYGAGDAKLGTIVGGGAKEGKRLKANFFKKIPAVKELIEGVKGAVDSKGYLRALDGNRYAIRSAHSALNVLLQGAGALVMKYYVVFLDEHLQKEFKYGEQYEFVGNIHDEVQIECDEDISKRIKDICESTFSRVTEKLGFKIPIKGTASIGDSWRDTH